MSKQKEILNQFQESISGMSKTFLDFSKQFKEISKEAEKNLSKKELEMINEFKEKAKTLKGADFSSLMELKEVYEKKLKNGV